MEPVAWSRFSKTRIKPRKTLKPPVGYRDKFTQINFTISILLVTIVSGATLLHFSASWLYLRGRSTLFLAKSKLMKRLFIRMTAVGLGVLSYGLTQAQSAKALNVTTT